MDEPLQRDQRSVVGVPPKLGERKTPLSMNILAGLSRDWARGRKLFVCSFRPIFPENVRSYILLLCFFFSLPTNLVKHWCKLPWKLKPGFINRVLVVVILRPRNAFRNSVFGASKLASTKTPLLNPYYRLHGIRGNRRFCYFFRRFILF